MKKNLVSAVAYALSIGLILGSVALLTQPIKVTAETMNVGK